MTGNHLSVMGQSASPFFQDQRSATQSVAPVMVIIDHISKVKPSLISQQLSHSKLVEYTEPDLKTGELFSIEMFRFGRIKKIFQ